MFDHLGLSGLGEVRARLRFSWPPNLGSESGAGLVPGYMQLARPGTPACKARNNSLGTCATPAIL
eukprot:4580880-Amphidinium_carterae.1